MTISRAKVRRTSTGFSFPVSKVVLCAQAGKETMDNKEVAKEIVIAMIEKGAFSQRSTTDHYVSEVCKAFKAVYQTVKECENPN